MRLELPSLLRAYDKEVTRQVKLMKERMADALAGRVDPGKLEAETRDVHQQLDAAMAVLRQLAEVRFAIHVTPEAIRLKMDAQFVPATLFRRFAKRHAPGDLGLMRWCPRDAVVVALHNLSPKETVKRELASVLGPKVMRALFPRDAAPPGCTLAALFLTGKDEAPFEFLEIRSGQRAREVDARWQSYAEAEPGKTDLPVLLRPVKAEQAAGVRLARLLPNDMSLGQGAARALRRILGPGPLAVQTHVDQRSVLAVGQTPQELLLRVRQAGRNPGLAVPSRKSYRLAAKVLPRAPNAMVYVSPVGMRRWLALGGVELAAPGPDEPGLIAAQWFTQTGGVSTVIRFPSGALGEALTKAP